MDPKLFATVFVTVFLAELGDKTQIATLLYAADASASKLVVFGAAAAALVTATALGVVAGGWLAAYLDERVLRWVAGGGFLAVGAWVLLRP